MKSALVTLFITVVMPMPGLAATLTSGLLLVDGSSGEKLTCTLVNAGTKPLIGEPAGQNISVQIVDENGNDISFGTSCGTVLAPGVACSTGSGPGTAFGYCKVTFAGSKKSARASLSRQGVGFLVTIPVQ